MKTTLLNSKISVMKRILFIVAIAAFMVACNRTPISSADAAEFAEFQAWKAQTEAAALEASTIAATTKYVAPRKTTTARKSAAPTYKSPVMVSESQSPAKVKKGWSKAAKGAVIGAGTGAVAGAIINKRNRVAGGVIGGVIGGAVGYGVGRSMDRKDGRVAQRIIM